MVRNMKTNFGLFKFFLYKHQEICCENLLLRHRVKCRDNQFVKIVKIVSQQIIKPVKRKECCDRCFKCHDNQFVMT